MQEALARKTWSLVATILTYLIWFYSLDMIHADCNVLRMCKSNHLSLAFPLFGNAEVQEITENMGFCGQMGALIANFAAFVTRLH